MVVGRCGETGANAVLHAVEALECVIVPAPTHPWPMVANRVKVVVKYLKTAINMPFVQVRNHKFQVMFNKHHIFWLLVLRGTVNCLDPQAKLLQVLIFS